MDKKVVILAKTLAGMCRSGGDNHGKIYHAVASDTSFDAALCGREPGKRSVGWTMWPRPIEDVTCAKCLKKLAVASKPL